MFHWKVSKCQLLSKMCVCGCALPALELVTSQMLRGQAMPLKWGGIPHFISSHFTTHGIGRGKGKQGKGKRKCQGAVFKSFGEDACVRLPYSCLQAEVLTDTLTQKANERVKPAITAHSLATRHHIHYVRESHLLQVENNPGHNLHSCFCRTCSILRLGQMEPLYKSREKLPFFQGSLVHLAVLVQSMIGTTICREPTDLV